MPSGVTATGFPPSIPWIKVLAGLPVSLPINSSRRPSGVLDHPSRIFLVGPRGRQREIYNLETLSTKMVVQDVNTVLEEAAKRRPGS